MYKEHCLHIFVTGYIREGTWGLTEWIVSPGLSFWVKTPPTPKRPTQIQAYTHTNIFSLREKAFVNTGTVTVDTVTLFPASVERLRQLLST